MLLLFLDYGRDLVVIQVILVILELMVQMEKMVM